MRTMILRYLVALVLLANVAGAESRPTQPPPARFDHPFNGVTDIRQINAKTVHKQCGKLLGLNIRGVVRGCANVVAGVCVIYIAKKSDALDFDLLIRHERAHCNGWPPNHKG